MFKILIILIIIIIAFHFRHTRIKFKTFFKKGFAPKRGKFGVYCYCGKQGKGKTYSAVEFINSNNNYPIYSNVHLKDIDYTYICGLDELLSLRDKKHIIIVFDEIFTILTKGSKMTSEILDFLSQMRKREIIFITTAQEWLEINITLRRYCRYQIECNMINFLGLGILIKHIYDAEQLKWSNLDNEYIAPLVETSISKCNIAIAKKYDTFEQIATSRNKSQCSNGISQRSENMPDTKFTFEISDKIVQGEEKQNFSSALLNTQSPPVVTTTTTGETRDA